LGSLEEALKRRAAKSGSDVCSVRPDVRVPKDRLRAD